MYFVVRMKRREIPLNARARKAIMDYLRVRPKVESEYLFLVKGNQDGHNLTDRQRTCPSALL